MCRRYLLVEQFILQAVIEAFDQEILLRFAGVYLMQIGIVTAGTFQNSTTYELCAVVTNDASRVSRRDA